jgi:hypothetical protein
MGVVPIPHGCMYVASFGIVISAQTGMSTVMDLHSYSLTKCLSLLFKMGFWPLIYPGLTQSPAHSLIWPLLTFCCGSVVCRCSGLILCPALWQYCPSTALHWCTACPRRTRRPTLRLRHGPSPDARSAGPARPSPDRTAACRLCIV